MTQHDAKRPLQCKFYDSGFKVKAHLTSHFASIHEGKRYSIQYHLCIICTPDLYTCTVDCEFEYKCDNCRKKVSIKNLHVIKPGSNSCTQMELVKLHKEAKHLLTFCIF